MSGDSLVSIILPTYNRAHILPAALASCLNQDYRNLEIIVVDDGSIDETSAVVAEVARIDSRVRYIKQENRKLPEALNTGHRAARGAYLTWTSDDNRYDRNAISIMVEHLENHQDIGLVYCNLRVFDASTNVTIVRQLPGPGNFIEDHTVGACFLYRREVYETVGPYDPATFLAEDYDYWIRIGMRYAAAHLADVAPYTIHTHDGRLSFTRGGRVALQQARVKAKHTPSPLRRHRCLAEGCLMAARAYRREHSYAQAIKYALAAIAHCPYRLRYYYGLAGALRQAVRYTSQ